MNKSKKIIKIIKKIIYYINFFIWYIFFDLIVKISKKILMYIKRKKIYEKIINYINQSNDVILLISFMIIVIIAETFATIGVFLIAKGFFILGSFFYLLKIITYIPSIDIFEQNKNRLIKYKIIQIGYITYEKIENNFIFLKIKKEIKIIYQKVKKVIKKNIKKYIKLVKYYINKNKKERK